MTNAIPADEVAVFRRVSKDGEHGPHGFQKIDETEKLFRKPTLLCCGGMFANSSEKEGEKNTNGYVKLGHGLLSFPESFPTEGKNNFKPEIDIVSVLYPESSHTLGENHYATMSALQSQKPAKPNESARKFVERHLMPLVQDDAGHALPPETVKRNLRNIQVLTHSYGANFIQQAGDVLVAKMEKLDFTPDQIRDATSQVLVVAVGPIIPPATGRASFTTISIINNNDTEIRNSYDIGKTLKELFRDADLLVDGRNAPVPKDAKVEGRFSQHYPAKPLNILPVATAMDEDGVHVSKAPGSTQWLACASQPLIVNGIGDIIRIPTIPGHERSNERGVFDGEQTNAIDNTHHQPHTYFSNKRQRAGVQATAPSEHTEHATTLRTLMSSLLINGMNNAVVNANGAEFTPIPSADTLMQLPRIMEYQTALDVPLRRTATLDNYDQKLATGLIASRPVKASHIG